MTSAQLPDSCLKIIDEYLNKPDEPTPYYRYTKKRGFLQKRHLIGKGSPTEIKKYKVGVDCSGFVCHIIDSNKKIKTVIKPTSNNSLNKLLFFFRPIENINVKTLIHPKNSAPVLTKNIKPGDLIHIGSKHILIIYKTTVNKIHFAHSSDKHLTVTTSVVTITDSTKSLGYQVWQDEYYHHRFITIPNSDVKRLLRWPYNT